MAATTVHEAAQYLTFTLNEEVFAREIAKIREVLGFTAVTKVPRTPGFLRGVINLRGNVVPVVDLKSKLGMGAAERTVNTCVVITEVTVDGGSTVIGALADSVREVIDLDPTQVEPPPRIGTRLDTAFIRGMGKRDGEFLILFDVDQVSSAAERGLAAAGT